MAVGEVAQADEVEEEKDEAAADDEDEGAATAADVVIASRVKGANVPHNCGNGGGGSGTYHRWLALAPHATAIPTRTRELEAVLAALA